MAYTILVLLLMALGVFFHLALHYLWEMGIPSDPFGAAPSSFGGISVLALMALGLSIRGVQNWVKLEKQVDALLEERAEKLAIISELRQNLLTPQHVEPDGTSPHDFNDLEGQQPLMWEDNELGIPPPRAQNISNERSEKDVFRSPPQ